MHPTTTKIDGFQNLASLIKYFDSDEKCIDYLANQRWGEKINCVFCNGNRVYILKGKNRRYKCAFCRRQFSVKSGTIFENSKIPLAKWFSAIYIVESSKKSVTSVQLMRSLEITQKTAWHMLQKINYVIG